MATVIDRRYSMAQFHSAHDSLALAGFLLSEFSDTGQVVLYGVLPAVPALAVLVWVAMKTTQTFAVLMNRAGCVLLLAALGAVASLQAETVARLETERRNDEKMYAMMRQMLVDFGYKEKAELLDTAWKKTKTPQQWAALPKDQATTPATPITPSPEIIAVAKQCEAAASGGFERVLQAACRASRNPLHITGGLLLWTQQGGKPLLQGQPDKALHFIYAAHSEATLGGGVAVSVLKERHDLARGKPYDCDDMAAGFAGTEWVRRAKTDAGWIEQWASARKTLAANLPSLRYGTGNQSQQYASQIQNDVLKSYNR
jgi:hypothetical protein